jgi:hypothetical protein
MYVEKADLAVLVGKGLFHLNFILLRERHFIVDINSPPRV